MNIKNLSSVSALVVNHNGGQDVLNCLNALLQQPFPLEEIVVVDNASTDNSQSNILKQFPGVNLIQLDQNLGLSKARNIGLNRVSSDLVLILDDDVYVHKDCIHQLYRTYMRYRPAVVCPRILLFPDTKTVQCDGAEPHFIGTLKLRHTYHSQNTLALATTEVLGCIGACRLVNRKVVLSSAGFDDLYFLYFEDLEFSLRIRSFGYSIICEPKAIVFHDRGAGTPGLSFRRETQYPKKRVYIKIRCRLMTLLIHYKLRTLLVLFPAISLYELAIFLGVIKRGWHRVWLKAILSIAKDKAYIVARRKFIAANRRRCDRELLSGGQLPFARGFTQDGWERMAVRALSAILDLYWKTVKNMIG
jgi:GT2 family glycosyltransferase